MRIIIPGGGGYCIEMPADLWICDAQSVKLGVGGTGRFPICEFISAVLSFSIYAF
jgi:hypothetical protein